MAWLVCFTTQYFLWLDTWHIIMHYANYNVPATNTCVHGITDWQEGSPEGILCQAPKSINHKIINMWYKLLILLVMVSDLCKELLFVLLCSNTFYNFVWDMQWDTHCNEMANVLRAGHRAHLAATSCLGAPKYGYFGSGVWCNSVSL